jgi:hypothetical protein
MMNDRLKEYLSVRVANTPKLIHKKTSTVSVPVLDKK